VLYRDGECRGGGWPMVSPNPNAKDMDTAKKLVELSYELVGLNESAQELTQVIFNI
jgi:retinol dehydrogenase-13